MMGEICKKNPLYIKYMTKRAFTNPWNGVSFSIILLQQTQVFIKLISQSSTSNTKLRRTSERLNISSSFRRIKLRRKLIEREIVYRTGACSNLNLQTNIALRKLRKTRQAI